MNTSKLNIPREAIEAFCKKWRIVELSLFGSVLREDFGPGSDVDVLVTFEDGAPWTLLDLMRATHELEDVLGRSVDLIERPALERHGNPYLRRGILERTQLVYAA